MEHVETVYPGVSGHVAAIARLGTRCQRAHTCAWVPFFCGPGVGGKPFHCHESRVARSCLKFVAGAGTRPEKNQRFDLLRCGPSDT